MSTGCQQHATYTGYGDDAMVQDWSTAMPQVAVYDYASSAQGYVPFTSALEYTQRPGCLHYVPPDAVSTRYYALQDPNVYISESQIDSSPAPLETFCHEPPSESPSPSPVSTVFPSSAHDVSMTSPYEYDHEHQAELGYDNDYLYEQQAATPAPSPIPEDLYAPSGSAAYANPDLPKQRSNRDDPSGSAGPLAQSTAQYEGQGLSAALGATYLAHGGEMYSPAIMEEYIEQKPRDVPEVIPSQWKLGAALDQLRFPEYGGDWNMVMARASGRPYEQTFPRSRSPLNEEDTARFAEMKRSLGLQNPEYVEREKTPTPTPPATPVTDVDDRDTKPDPSKMVIYSPTTARRIPVSSGPSGPVLRLTNATKRPYKRGTHVACAFCRRRKIACGGPQEGDEARRCGQCIYRRQPCEWPGSYQWPARPQTRSGSTSPVELGKEH
ncbi:hypothetical protein L227DRAFT_580551 [Lentinus tigrinus ALCF2SS1-6]|uniref:Zn(2)-C6 fungal-type domain-containing protein n=2 Tax=Lentinus tigrinus TaxID=5365 RepID=A0A5C2RVX9_9APHY|nr:hypothetical protein L227DRAFT_580551 [Lentinus tigrinus ALCF2SS1-6]